jgi:hypothetical protein
MGGISISCVENRDDKIDRAAAAVEQTARCVKVDCVYWFSNRAYPRDLSGIEAIHIQIGESFGGCFDEVNRVYLRVMPRVVATEFNLVVQSDGFATNPNAWDEKFLEYDYIGAPWPWMWGGGPNWTGPIVGNGGFSLRSRKLYRALTDMNIKWRSSDWLSDERSNIEEYYGIDYSGSKYIPEDLLISLWFRSELQQKYDVRFCPPDIANRFSVETVHSFTQRWLGRSFGFHGVAAAPYYGVTL